MRRRELLKALLVAPLAAVLPKPRVPEPVPLFKAHYRMGCRYEDPKFWDGAEDHYRRIKLQQAYTDMIQQYVGVTDYTRGVRHE